MRGTRKSAQAWRSRGAAETTVTCVRASLLLARLLLHLAPLACVQNNMHLCAAEQERRGQPSFIAFLMQCCMCKSPV